jgi:hypothetical protein
MTLLEAWESEVSRREAVTEVLMHGISINAFYSQCGYKCRYMGSDVLTFLGY